jgi:hypothetical protein
LNRGRKRKNVQKGGKVEIEMGKVKYPRQFLCKGNNSKQKEKKKECLERGKVEIDMGKVKYPRPNF